MTPARGLAFARQSCLLRVASRRYRRNRYPAATRGFAPTQRRQPGSAWCCPIASASIFPTGHPPASAKAWTAPPPHTASIALPPCAIRPRRKISDDALPIFRMRQAARPLRKLVQAGHRRRRCGAQSSPSSGGSATDVLRHAEVEDRHVWRHRHRSTTALAWPSPSCPPLAPSPASHSMSSLAPSHTALIPCARGLAGRSGSPKMALRRYQARRFPGLKVRVSQAPHGKKVAQERSVMPHAGRLALFLQALCTHWEAGMPRKRAMRAIVLVV